MIPQDMVRHLTACLVLGLEALHSCDVLYRALSPELVFLDSRYGPSMGHVCTRKEAVGNALLCKAGQLSGESGESGEKEVQLAAQDPLASRAHLARSTNACLHGSSFCYLGLALSMLQGLCGAVGVPDVQARSVERLHIVRNSGVPRSRAGATAVDEL